MPSRNVIRSFAPDNYYHVYNRGVAKQTIFHDAEDYQFFIELLRRYVDIDPHTDNKGRAYQHMREDVELLSYCLMPNHFHLLFYLHEAEAISKLMRAVSTTYTMHYNKKYNRVGTLLQGNYKASMISSDEYLIHISRYIHLNPEDFMTWPYSSLSVIIGKEYDGLIMREKILELHDNNPSHYMKFINDYEAHKAILNDLKHELADH